MAAGLRGAGKIAGAGCLRAGSIILPRLFGYFWGNAKSDKTMHLQFILWGKMFGH